MIKDALANKLHPTLRALEEALWEEVRTIGGRAKGVLLDDPRLDTPSSKRFRENLKSISYS